MQKLLYYAQGWHLAINKDVLFDDELEAWIHGPVVPEVYRKYKAFSWQPIAIEESMPDLPKPTAEFLVELSRAYFPIDAYELELMTHRESPWLIARGDLPPDASCNRTINIKDVQAYFTSLLKNG